MIRLFFFITLILVHSITVLSQTRKLIIDCDPGIDDATALVLAMQYPGFDILGITTVFGNAYVDQCTKNALRIVELSGKNIPVYKGAEKPMSIPIAPPPDFIHGKDGLGNTNQPDPKTSCQKKPAAQFIVDMVKTYPGQVTIVAVGRLTNLAEAIKLDSSVIRNVKEVVLMGGALRVPGNATPVGEANISGDPHAADIVFTARWKVTMLGLDVTTKVKLNDDILLRTKNRNSRYGSFIFSVTRLYMDFHKNVDHIEGGFYVHDPSAIMYLIDSSIFQTTRGPVRVVTDGIAMGQTIMPAYDYQMTMQPWAGKPFVTAAIAVDTNQFLQKFESIMESK